MQFIIQLSIFIKDDMYLSLNYNAQNAQVVELVDTRDLKSSKATSCRFKSGSGHHLSN